MIKFNPNTLDAELVQGDTGTFSFSIVDKKTKKNFINPGDEVCFTLKKIIDQSVIIQKKIIEFPNNIVTIPLPPSETKELEAGNYIYDLKLKRSDGNIDTLNPNRPYSYFSVKKGVD